MKKIYFIILLATSSLQMAASDLITAPPATGVGKQIASIHSFSSEVNTTEGVYNMLYNTTDGAGSKKKWCDEISFYPWVIYELSDIYKIDKLVLRDVKPYESEYGNVPEYWISVTTSLPNQCEEWTEVAHANNAGGVNVKTITLNQPVEARYIKLKVSRGIKSNGDKDLAVRLFGFDVYGTFSRTVERDMVSVGKTILGFSGDTPFYYERPLNILDGNLQEKNNKWTLVQPSSSDSLAWVVIDLENQYNINMFKLYDGAFLETGMPNMKGYNVYVSSSAPNMALINKNEDKNTCWTKVVDAYAANRSSSGVKTDEIAPIQARYVKLEIPRSRSAILNRIFQFEVYEDSYSSIDKNVVTKDAVEIFPNPVKRGQLVNVPQQDASISIYNLSGVLISNQIVKASNPTISTSMLYEGIYLLGYTSENTSGLYKLSVVK